MSPKSIPFRLWPLQHQQLYQSACERAPTLSSQKGRAAHWRPATHRAARHGWGLWLQHLVDQGKEIDEPSDCRPSPETLNSYVRSLLPRVRYTTACQYLVNLSEALRVMQPASDRTLVVFAARDLERAARPMEDKVSAAVGTSNIYAGAMERMNRAKSHSLTNWRSALEYLDGLRLAIDVLTGTRLLTLTLMTEGHFHRMDCGRYRLSFSGDETKTRKSDSSLLPQELSSYIEHGMRVAAMLRGNEGGDRAIWVTKHGTRMSPRQVYQRTHQASLQELNVPLGTQRIRRVIATSLAKFAPSQSHLARPALQHGARVTDKYYVKDDGWAAAKEFSKYLRKRFDDDRDA